MTKLGLLFVAVFCLVQISMAARVPRDAPVETTTDFFVGLANKVGEGLQSAQKELQSTFTKENADKLWGSIREAGEKVNTQLQEFGKDVQNKYSELTKDSEQKP